MELLHYTMWHDFICGVKRALIIEAMGVRLL